MPVSAPFLCQCGRIVKRGEVCPCRAKAARERKARFDKTRPTARERGYTAEWERESKAFLKDNPKCKRCDQAATIVDHVQPHKGNQALFWNRANWQPLCRTHHNSAKQAEERRALERK